MAHLPRKRRSMVMALLATTAAASLLGACGQTGGGLFSRGPAEVQMTAAEAAKATSQWAVAYAKNPKDPEMALGYAKSLRALGNKQRSLEILKTAYRANPQDGEVAAELGKVALEAGRVDIASKALQTAESQGIKDWKTLSAQGTLHAKKGEHTLAQEYFRAALQKKPDSVSVINNLALSYALDGKADESETLLRKAAENGQDDKRIRQNLALVLGVQGKFDEARQVAAVDMTETQAKSSMSYLRNMLSKPTAVASAEPSPQPSTDDWSPFATSEPVEPAPAPPPVKTASAKAPAKAPTRELPKVQMVKPVDEVVESPAKVAQAKAAQPPAPNAAANLLRAAQ
jgi:Flp pilus assembly protein TadD